MRLLSLHCAPVVMSESDLAGDRVNAARRDRTGGNGRGQEERGVLRSIDQSRTRGWLSRINATVLEKSHTP